MFRVLVMVTAILTCMMVVFDLPKWVAWIVLALAVAELIDILFAYVQERRKE